MSKIKKLLLILSLILSISSSFCFVHATSSDNLNSVNETTTSSNSSLSDLSASSVTRVSQLNNYSQANLELNNILSIILISIGVLLILFAIAILIRLKR